MKRQEISFVGENFFTGETTEELTVLPCPPKINPVQIKTGRKHALVLDDNGGVWAFGVGSEGQLGLGPDVLVSNFLQKVAFPKRAVKPINTFRKTVFPEKEIISDNTLSKFQGKERKLNLLNFHRSIAPETVGSSDDLNDDDKIASIETCALTSGAITKSGKVFLWGKTYQSSFFMPRIINLWSIAAIQLAFGNQHIIALCKNQGNNLNNNNSNNNSNSNNIINNNNNNNDTENTVWTWGRSSQGALGRGKEVIQCSDPMQLQFFNNKKPVLISANFTTSSVVTESGELYVWGRIGKLNEFTPIKFEIPNKTKEENNEGEGLNSHGCGSSGALGSGELGDVSTPTPIPFNSDIYGKIKMISCSHSHAAILSDKGFVFTVGRGDFGQLANQKLSNELSLYFVTLVKNVQTISCSSRTTFFLYEKKKFLQPLELQSDRYDCPTIIHDIIDFFSNIDLSPAVGLFTQKGDPDKLIDIFEYYNNSFNEVELNQNYIISNCNAEDVYTIGNLLLEYLSCLTEPLIPYIMQINFGDKFYSSTPKFETLLSLYKSMSYLPPSNFNLLKHLLTFLHRVAKYEDSNKLDIPKLSSIFYKAIFGGSYNNKLSLAKLIENANLWFLSKNEFFSRLIRETIESVSSSFIDHLIVIENRLQIDWKENKEVIFNNLLQKVIIEYLTTEGKEESSDEEMFVRKLLILFFPSSLDLEKLFKILSDFRTKNIDLNCKIAIAGAIMIFSSIKNEEMESLYNLIKLLNA